MSTSFFNFEEMEMETRHDKLMVFIARLNRILDRRDMLSIRVRQWRECVGLDSQEKLLRRADELAYESAQDDAANCYKELVAYCEEMLEKGDKE